MSTVLRTQKQHAGARDRIATRMNDLAGLDDVDQVSRYQEDRASFDQDVFEFFSLTDGEQALVQETVDVLMPSIRPRSFRSLDTPAQSVTQLVDIAHYSTTLANALDEWRRRMGGRGSFLVSVVTSGIERPGAIGVVRIEYRVVGTKRSSSAVCIDDQAVRAALEELRGVGIAGDSSVRCVTTGSGRASVDWGGALISCVR